MASRIVIDGNAFYEIDEDCMKRKREAEKRTGGKEGETVIGRGRTESAGCGKRDTRNHI